jgi:hypothetical protein
VKSGCSQGVRLNQSRFAREQPAGVRLSAVNRTVRFGSK